jgi:hypothetical protein
MVCAAIANSPTVFNTDFSNFAECLYRKILEDTGILVFTSICTSIADTGKILVIPVLCTSIVVPVSRPASSYYPNFFSKRLQEIEHLTWRLISHLSYPTFNGIND